MKNGAVLLVRRAQEPWKGMWDVPGGFCNPGEHPSLTAEREVFEETGIRIRIVGFLGMWLDDYADEHDTGKRTLNIYYHAEVAAAGVGGLDQTEITDARFFAPSQLPTDMAFRHVPLALAAWSRAVVAGHVVTPLFDRSAV